MKVHVSKEDLQYIKEDLQYIKESIQKDDVLTEDLRRWFKEKWVDVSRKVKGKHPPCGRKDASGKAYPKCRPSKKVSKATPKIASSYNKKEKKAMTSQKRRAEKEDPKTGKGNKPTVTKFDEGLEKDTTSYPMLVDKSVQISEALNHHILSKKPLTESDYKSGSDELLELLEDCKILYLNGELDLSDEDVTFIYENEFGKVEQTNYVATNLLNEAEYQGRKVTLNKPMQGDVKKFKVYVKNDKGKVVKVNFGFGGKSAKGKRMVIKKDNPARRKSFRARFNCDNPGPKDSSRYWACRAWS
jgi:hypothetical protein